jgi:hypothetical protein
MERWTFNMIAGADGKESQVRMILRAGDDSAAYPTLQVGVDGVEVPVDDAPVDYEAPEWKALQIFSAGGGSADLWEDLKDKLRSNA